MIRVLEIMMKNNMCLHDINWCKNYDAFYVFLGCCDDDESWWWEETFRDVLIMIMMMMRRLHELKKVSLNSFWLFPLLLANQAQKGKETEP